MTQKLLISTDRNGIAEFQKAVQATCDAAISLISIFNEFQSYEVITTEEQFSALLADPGSYFDAVLLSHVKLDTGGRKPDPAVLASLVGLHRDEYLNAVAGLPLTSDDCPECQRAKVIPGRKAISKYQFDQYRDYLLFSAGFFTVNTTAVDADLDKFSTYAESAEELSLCTLHHDLVNILNEYTSLYPISSTDRLAIKGALKLHLTNGGDGLFMVNTETLKNAINKLKYTNHGN